MNHQNPTDISIEALIAGDADEFVRVVDAFSPSIYRLGLRMLGNEQDAEDILQNTFMNAYANLSKFEGRSSISTWLYRIASNEALMLIRKKKPDVSLDVEEEGSLKPVNLTDWSALPEKQLRSGEGREMLEKTIASLPEPLRIVFILRDINELSIKETSEALQLSETNVKTRLLRARLALREALSKYHGEYAQQGESHG